MRMCMPMGRSIRRNLAVQAEFLRIELHPTHHLFTIAPLAAPILSSLAF